MLGAFALASLLAAPLGASAAPEATEPKPAERGLLETAASKASPLVQQVRDQASDLVLSAMNFLGVPYRRGGNTESGFDCSGFTRAVFERSVGLVLPRRADEQAHAPGLLTVKRDELKPGDLVFFNTLKRTFSHVGIYIGEGKFIHAPRPGGEVRVEDLGASYWARHFTGARRTPLATEPAAAAAATAAVLPAAAAAPVESLARSAVGNRPPAQ